MSDIFILWKGRNVISTFYVNDGGVGMGIKDANWYPIF